MFTFNSIQNSRMKVVYHILLRHPMLSERNINLHSKTNQFILFIYLVAELKKTVLFFDKPSCIPDVKTFKTFPFFNVISAVSYVNQNIIYYYVIK